MKTVGIICEYNPFHLGHEKQIRAIKERYGPETVVVCLMSGNFVQRGAPAIFDKSLRARAAVDCGADVVLELPVTVSLSSAEGFAAGGVGILGRLCDTICFGSESANADALFVVARALLSDGFSEVLRKHLDTGCSFPTARCNALRDLGVTENLPEKPNDILAVEYCKAILSSKSAMEALILHREGNYHTPDADAKNPSATALRRKIEAGEPWLSYTPGPACVTFQNAAIHTLQAGERAMLGRLRTMSETEFSAVPYGSEGLWRKLMHACRRCGGLEEIASEVKSKRYTRSRIDRMLLCAFLGLRQEDMGFIPSYIRVLAFSPQGTALLKQHRKDDWLLHTGTAVQDAYTAWEQRCDDVYGLFCVDKPEPAGISDKRRVYIKRPD